MATTKPQSPDPKALKILFDTYWSSKGWKQDPKAPPDDLAYAIEAGVMFPPQDFSHDDVVRQVVSLAKQFKAKDIGAAFLAGLSSARHDLRSALASYAMARHLPEHRFVTSEHRSQRECALCGESSNPVLKEDVNVLNFERFKWGGVRHLNMYYVAFDLARFAETAPPKPTAEDRDILQRILDAARTADAKMRPAALEQAISSFVPGAKESRKTLLQILGIAGVLQPKEHPSFLDRFVGYEEIVESENDWEFPFCWWRGSDGVNEAAVKFWWPKL